MGKNSRNRRNAKRRKQEARRRDTRASDSPGSHGPAQPEDPEPCPCARCQRSDEAPLRNIEDWLINRLSLLWESGWQPVEVVRQARRSSGRDAADLVRIAILVDNSQREKQRRDPLWVAQVESLGDPSSADDVNIGWLERWCLAGPAPDSRSHTSTELLLALVELGPIHRMIPPPGSDVVDVVQLRTDVDDPDPVLAKVRALLNKAESTEFAAEAESFTAKAQALISRHSLADVLGESHGGDCRLASIRIPLDGAYVRAKASLLAVVAVASRCQSIYLTSYAMCSVIGRPRELRRVEILFTSLLVQAQAALDEVGRAASPGSSCRSRSFRSSFLSGYASRIGQRLVAERDRAVQSYGPDALPVVARIDSEVEDEVERLFGGDLTSARSRTYNSLGWGSGVDAADSAQIRDGGLATAGSPAELPQRPREGSR